MNLPSFPSDKVSEAGPETQTLEPSRNTISAHEFVASVSSVPPPIESPTKGKPILTGRFEARGLAMPGAAALGLGGEEGLEA